MPPRSLSDAELQRLGSWPEEIARSDVVAFFTVDVDDLRWVHTSRSSANRLGLGVQLCALRFLGFIPEDLDATPGDVVARLVEQIAATADDLGRYSAATSERVRREHAAAVVRRAGWSMCGRGEWKRLADWLTDRALEHDTPGVLFHQALDHLRYQQIVRPGLDRLMRAVGSARVRADTAIYRRVSPLLTVELCERLDVLITTDPQLRVAPLVWLNSGATTTSAEAIKTEIAKLDHLRAIGADGLGLGAIPPERRRQLAAVARRSSPKALREMAPERRYPMLLAAIADIHGRVVDEIVQLFDQALAATDSRARNQVADHIQALARADVERLVLLEQIIGVIRDDDLDDATVGARLRGLGRERLAAAARREDEPLPRDGGHLQLLEARYNYFRSFAPHVLAALSFEASTTPSDTLTAVNVLREMNRDGRRHVPADAPDGFVPRPLAALPHHRPRRRQRHCLPALLGGLRAVRPP